MDETDLRGEHANLIKILLRKRGDIAFHITELERQGEGVRADLAHIDAVIRLFAPDIAPDAMPERLRHPRRLNYFAHGEITRRVYDMMRGGGTVAAIDVAKQAIEEKSLSFEDRPGAPSALKRSSIISVSLWVAVLPRPWHAG